MKDYLPIGIDNSSLTSYVFYQSLIPKLHKYFKERSAKVILLDFSNVRRVSPLVVPNLLNLGFILKKYYGEPVKIIIPWDIDLVSYLRDINFYHYARHFGIFDLDQGISCDIPKDRTISLNCYTFGIKKGFSDLDEILRDHIIKYKKYLIRVFKDETIVNELLKQMAEMCLNTSKYTEHSVKIHENDKCIEYDEDESEEREISGFATFQVNKTTKFQFSVSDIGIGYYQSFNKKLRNGEELKFLSKNDFKEGQKKHVESILEAVFYRMNDIYGIYSVLEEVLSRDGTIRIHTYDSQIVFTKNFYNKYLNSNQVLDYKYLIQSIRESSSLKRINGYFRGVHVEIEIPFPQEVFR